MIAISYRREDSLAVAGRLYDRLEQKFGKQNVFMDFDSIRPGLDFREQIKDTIERSKVVIAIIGPNWVGEHSDGSRRIDDPTDFVRLEIACALQRGIPVIPVLVNNTPVPQPEKLPSDIQGLVYRHALPLDSGLDFRQHAERLMNGIGDFVTALPPPISASLLPEMTDSSPFRRSDEPPKSKIFSPVKTPTKRSNYIILWVLVVVLLGISATLLVQVKLAAPNPQRSLAPRSDHKPTPTATGTEAESELERAIRNENARRHSGTSPSGTEPLVVAPLAAEHSPVSPLVTPQLSQPPPSPLVQTKDADRLPSTPPQQGLNGPTVAATLASAYVKKYGFSVLLPIELFPDASARLANPQIDRLESANGCASVAFKMISAPLKTTYESYVANFPNSTEQKELDYKVLKNSWFVVSGGTPSTGYYTKGVKRGNQTILMELEYTGSACNIPGGLLTEISQKFDGTAK